MLRGRSPVGPSAPLSAGTAPDAGATSRIAPFSGAFAFLSNFYPAPVEWRGLLFPSVENAFQAAKTDDPEAHAALAALPPDQAAELGRRAAIRPAWDEVRLAVMADLLRAKFEIPVLRRRLLATGSALLVNEAWWGDKFWGISRGRGDNHLGRLLMELRDELAG